MRLRSRADADGDAEAQATNTRPPLDDNGSSGIVFQCPPETGNGSTTPEWISENAEQRRKAQFAIEQIAAKAGFELR
jgi:hypothetical protein